MGGPPGENNLLLQLVILLVQLMGVCNNLKLCVGHSPVHLLQELKDEKCKMMGKEGDSWLMQLCAALKD